MWKQSQMVSYGSSTPSAFSYWVDKYCLKNVRQLKQDESYKVEDIECGMHGHVGIGGSKGNFKAMARKLAVKFVDAHGHGPGIFNGGYRVGLSALLRQEYNHGPSNWLHTHCLIHKGGKRQLITMIKGRHRR